MLIGLVRLIPAMSADHQSSFPMPTQGAVMFIEDILREKGSSVFSINPEATLDEVVQDLVRHNCGSLLVCRSKESCDGPDLVGIITERDILRACAKHRCTLAELKVDDFMTRNVVTGSPRHDVEHIMGLMTDNRVRHLPILDEGRLLGLISIGDVVKFQHQQMALENHYLKTYIQS
jgi:CBS domain-containing protein